MLFKQISIDDEIKFKDEQSTEIKQILEEYEEIKDGIKSK
jgi:hypothetical protein